MGTLIYGLAPSFFWVISWELELELRHSFEACKVGIISEALKGYNTHIGILN